MGDRANVHIHDGKDTGVYLYTHWSGYRLNHTVQEALKHRQRWNDYPYLARIVFQAMLGDDNGFTGFGIASSLRDNEYPVIHLDCSRQTVKINNKTWTMDDFIKLSEDEVKEAYSGG